MTPGSCTVPMKRRRPPQRGHARTSSSNARCSARTASSMYFSSITTLVLISLVVIIWMLMPSWLSTLNMRLATPTCERMPMPTMLTLQIFGSPSTFSAPVRGTTTVCSRSIVRW